MAVAETDDAAMFQEAADDAILTRMLSDRPGTPARRQQMPRTTSSICTPAWLAR